MGGQRQGIPVLPQRVVTRAARGKEMAVRWFPSLQVFAWNGAGQTSDEGPWTDDSVQAHRYVYVRLVCVGCVVRKHQGETKLDHSIVCASAQQRNLGKRNSVCRTMYLKTLGTTSICANSFTYPPKPPLIVCEYNTSISYSGISYVGVHEMVFAIGARPFFFVTFHCYFCYTRTTGSLSQCHAEILSEAPALPVSSNAGAHNVGRYGPQREPL